MILFHEASEIFLTNRYLHSLTFGLVVVIPYVNLLKSNIILGYGKEGVRLPLDVYKWNPVSRTMN